MAASFKHWVAAREQLPGLTPSDSNSLIHLIARYGPLSVSQLKDIGVTLPVPTLERLLSVLVGLGQLRTDRQGDETVYGAVWAW